MGEEEGHKHTHTHTHTHRCKRWMEQSSCCLSWKGQAGMCVQRGNLEIVMRRRKRGMRAPVVVDVRAPVVVGVMPMKVEKK